MSSAVLLFYSMAEGLKRDSTFPRGHEIYQASCKHHPVSSTCQVNHSTQRNNEILPSFLRGKLTHNISRTTFAVLYLLQNACKMFKQVFLVSTSV